MARVVDGQDHVLRQQLRVAEQSVHVLHPAARHARRVQRVDPVVDAVLADILVDDRVHAREISDAGVVVCEVRVVVEVREVEHLEEALQKDLAGGCDGNIAVLCAEQTVGTEHRVVVTGAARFAAGGEIVGAHIGQHADQPAHQARFDMLSTAVA